MPNITLIGKPNVGKSTLYNLLTDSHEAIVLDKPGITKDRKRGTARFLGCTHNIWDTGGWSSDEKINEQVLYALETSHLICLIVRADQIDEDDQKIARMAQKTKSPLLLIVNMMDLHPACTDHFRLGIKDSIFVSGMRKTNIYKLHNMIHTLCLPSENAGDQDGIRIAIVGRPNSGKSSLINALCSSNRCIVSEQAGTTVDSIEVPLIEEGATYRLIDTAGMRRKKNISEHLEKLAIHRSITAVRRSDVVILALTKKVTAQDKALLHLAFENNFKPILIALTKSDLGIGDTLKKTVSAMRYPYIQTSSYTKTGTKELLQRCNDLFLSAHHKFASHKLTRVITNSTYGKHNKVKYVHQGGSNPPTIVMHGRFQKALSDQEKVMLRNMIVREFEIESIPIKFKLISKQDKVNQE